MATLTELHRKTGKVVRPVIHGGKTVTLTDQGKAVAKIVPIKKEPDRKKLLKLLKEIGPLEIPPRK